MYLHKGVRVHRLPPGFIELRNTPLAPRLRLPRFPLSSNNSDRKYAGRQTTDTPGVPAPTVCVSLPILSPRFPAAFHPSSSSRHCSANGFYSMLKYCYFELRKKSLWQFVWIIHRAGGSPMF